MRTRTLRNASAVIGPAVRSWIQDDAPIVAYVFKSLLASMLALWISLRLELDQPRTALLTVAIVMQFRAGMVLAKSYYRLIGTGFGILASLLLVGLFAQERVLFLACAAVWIGLCTAGSVIYRNHQSYAFVLAGYTLCIVGLPSTLAPELTFNIAVTRLSEILVGLACATVVSDVVFPQRMWNVTLQAVRKRFIDFSVLVRTSARGASDRRAHHAQMLRFIGDIFSLESFRASAALETDASRDHRQRLSLLNREFMEVSTTFHALDRLLHRLEKISSNAGINALFTLYRELGDALGIAGECAKNEHEAAATARQLQAFLRQFAQRAEALRNRLATSGEPLLDFDTGLELLERLAAQLQAYSQTYAALAGTDTALPRRQDQDQPVQLELHFDPAAVALAALRGCFTLLILAAAWIFADWPSGVEAITIGTITSTLFAASPSPTKTIRDFLIGAAIGTVLAYFCNFHWLTQATDFPLLAIAISPGILLSTWLNSRPRTALIGAGMAVVYLMHLGFSGTYNAIPANFLNDAIADLIAILVSGTMYGLIDLSSSTWSRRRVAVALRRLVVASCKEPLTQRRSRLDSGARDLVQRSGSVHRQGEIEDKLVIEWLFSALEVGHAVIALREHASNLPAPLARHLQRAVDKIAALYQAPSSRRLKLATAAVTRALNVAQSEVSEYTLAPALQRQLAATLHFALGALRDSEALFTAEERTPGGTAHAA